MPDTTVPVITGKTLYDLVVANMGGYGSALNTPEVYAAINEGKNQIWAILKNLRADYFTRFSQYTDNSLPTYFAPLTTTTRSFSLPKECHEIKSIEVTNAGYEHVRFIHKDFSSAEFQEQRRLANTSASSQSQVAIYYYDIIGKGVMELAQYPEVAFNLRLLYLRALPDIDPDSSAEVEEILYPYCAKIVTFAVRRLTLGAVRDVEIWQAWRDEFKEDARTIEAIAGTRQTANTRVVEDYDPRDEE